jgi:hypothetical protein
MLYSRAGYRSARPIPSIAHIRLATHGRSIQMGQKQQIDDIRAMSACSPIATELPYYGNRRFGRTSAPSRNAAASAGGGAALIDAALTAAADRVASRLAAALDGKIEQGGAGTLAIVANGGSLLS